MKSKTFSHFYVAMTLVNLPYVVTASASASPGVATVQVGGHVLPTSNLAYDLGSSNARWRDLYLSGNTIDLGGTFLKRDEAGGGIKIESENGQEVDTNVRNVHASGYVNIAGTRLERHVTGPLMVKTGAGEGQMESGMFKHVYVDGTANASNVAIVAGAAAGAEPALSVKQYGTQPIADLWDADALVMRVADGGNVGIGTGVPMAKLHVDGNIFATGTVTASNLSVIGDFVTMNTVTSNTEQIVIENAGTGPALKVTQTGAQAIAEFYDDGGVLALKVADGGNVGIGTTNPQNKLHVLSDAFEIVTIERSGGAGAGAAFRLLNRTRAECYVFIGGDSNLYMQNGTNNENSVIVAANGFVGIGTTNPQTKLHVNGSLLVDVFGAQEQGIFFRNGFTSTNKYNCSITNYDHNNAGLTPDGISINGTDGVSICTGANSRNERFRVTGNGYVGIGTTDPIAQFHVNTGALRIGGQLSSQGVYQSGYIYIGGKNNNFDNQYIVFPNPSNADANGMQWWSSDMVFGRYKNTFRWSLKETHGSPLGSSLRDIISSSVSDSGGYVYVSSTTLHAGAVYRGDNGLNFSQTSDERIKTNIELANTSLCYDNIKQMPLKRFAYNTNLKPSFRDLQDKNILGLIAQDIQNVFPKAIFKTNDKESNIPDLLNIQFDQVVYCLYGAFQQAQHKIETLESQITTLLERIQKLETQ